MYGFHMNRQSYMHQSRKHAGDKSVSKAHPMYIHRTSNGYTHFLHPHNDVGILTYNSRYGGRGRTHERQVAHMTALTSALPPGQMAAAGTHAVACI